MNPNTILRIVRARRKLRLLSLQCVDALNKYGLSFFALSDCLRKEGINFACMRKLRLRKPILKALVNCSEYIDQFIQTADHFVRAKFVCGNRSSCSLSIQYNKFSSTNSVADKLCIAIGQARDDELARRPDLVFGAIQNRSGRLRSPKQRSFIGICNKLSRVPVLSAHYENRDPQSGNRANRLNPSRPTVLCKAHFVANDRNSHRSPDQCDSKKYIGFLHETTQSCLKGILA